MWKDISTAPRGHEVDVAIIDDCVHGLRHPCFHTGKGGVNSEAQQARAVKPTHWQHAPITAFLCCCS